MNTLKGLPSHSPVSVTQRRNLAAGLRGTNAPSGTPRREVATKLSSAQSQKEKKNLPANEKRLQLVVPGINYNLC